MQTILSFIKLTWRKQRLQLTFLQIPLLRQAFVKQCLYFCRGFINIRKGHKIKIIIINKVFSTHCECIIFLKFYSVVNNNRTWKSLESFGHAYVTNYIRNITIELLFSAPSRLSRLFYVHDKHTAKYLAVCQHYIHLSPETMQKLPLGTSLQGMEKCIPNLPFPSVQAVKYPKQLNEQKILENTFIAEIRLATFNPEEQQMMYPNPLPRKIWNQDVPCWAD